MFIGSKAPIMSAKEGGIYMDKFLKSFYDEHFVNRENNKIEDTAEYKKRSDHHEQLLLQIHSSLIKVLPAKEAIGLLNDFNDAMFHLLALYQYEDFKYYFLTGIQLGIEITRTKHPDLTVEQIMQLLHQIKEDNSC